MVGGGGQWEEGVKGGCLKLITKLSKLRVI